MNTPLKRWPGTNRALAASASLGIALLVASCGGGGGGGNGPGSTELNLVIGNSLPLRGDSSELGSSGASFDPDAVAVAYGDVTVCRGGVAADHDAGALEKTMAAPELLVAADLGLGAGAASVLTCDISHGYVDENKGTS